MAWCSARSSRKSNMYLTAAGRTQPRWVVLRIVSSRLSTYWCSAPCSGVAIQVAYVAGPLAARGGGQICRPFVLGFGNWRACSKYRPKSMLQPRILRIGARCSCNALFLLHANTLWNYTIWIFTWIFKNNFRPFAAPSNCRPVRPAPPAPPRYASGKGRTHPLSGKYIIFWYVISQCYSLCVKPSGCANIFVN